MLVGHEAADARPAGGVFAAGQPLGRQFARVPGQAVHHAGTGLRGIALTPGNASTRAIQARTLA